MEVEGRPTSSKPAHKQTISLRSDHSLLPPPIARWDLAGVGGSPHSRQIIKEKKNRFFSIIIRRQATFLFSQRDSMDACYAFHSLGLAFNDDF